MIFSAVANPAPFSMLRYLLLAANILLAALSLARATRDGANRQRSLGFAICAGLGFVLAAVALTLGTEHRWVTLFLSLFSLALATAAANNLSAHERSLEETTTPVPLAQDAEAVRALLAYVERNGLVADKDDVRQVSEATVEKAIDLVRKVEQSLAPSGATPLPLNDEVAFYDCYGRLATAVRPVTVASLRDSLPRPGKRWSEVEQTLHGQWRFLLASVILLVLGQAYTSIGYTLSTNLDRAYKTEIGLYSTPPGTNSEMAALPLETQRPLAAAELISGEASLEAWVRPVSAVLGNLGFHFTYDDAFVTNGVAPQAPSPADPKLPQSVGRRQFEETRTQAALLLAFLQSYLLPCLYGWAGAMVYIIRRLTVEANDRTFVAGAVHYGTRAWLGIVAGLAIGWFSTPTVTAEPATTGSAIPHLGPLPLAFLAGYAVEIFFSILDRFVRAFTDSPAPPPAKPTH